jgi:hypothetical protein
MHHTSSLFADFGNVAIEDLYWIRISRIRQLSRRRKRALLWMRLSSPVPTPQWRLPGFLVLVDFLRRVCLRHIKVGYSKRPSFNAIRSHEEKGARWTGLAFLWIGCGEKNCRNLLRMLSKQRTLLRFQTLVLNWGIYWRAKARPMTLSNRPSRASRKQGMRTI